MLNFCPVVLLVRRLNWSDDNADAAVLELRDTVKVETDDAVREGLFQEMQDYLLESGPYAPILQPGLQVGPK